MSIAIQPKSGTNFTLYYNVLNYFKTILSNHPSIQVVSYGNIEDIDTYQYPEYPIANVNILNADFGESVTNYSIELVLADKIKNKNNESTGETNAQTIPFYKTDDTVDIFANTLAIINDVTSYTQRGVQGFEINDDIVCVPFKDRFNNGLAGWVATFTLTTHNDKNRCLFFLEPPLNNGYIIESCLTGQRYKAIIDGNVTEGGVFSTLKEPGLSNTYPNLVCYIVVDFIEQAQWNFVNLPVLPPGMISDCATCNLWINPKVWSTTPAAWSGPNAEFRTWATV